MGEDLNKESLKLHEEKKGKLEICPKVELKTRRDLSLAYTPGVAEVCRKIAENKELAYKYTIKSNTVAIVTDGSAVLGLGNIGGDAAIPVMEGKAILFKEFANIDAFPICFEDYHTDFIEDVKNIAPVFGGINLEDIAAPKCFEVEEALQDIGIPVMHDDQHGTAVVLLGGLINAAKVVGKELKDLKIAVIGAGAAGTAIIKLLKCVGYDESVCTPVKDIVAVDIDGIIYRGRQGMDKYLTEVAEITNKQNIKGTIKDALQGADVMIGVSTGGIVTQEMVKSMNTDPIVFAMANPIPEIMPEEALKAGATVVATGRSDFHNQINNVLAFPGIFRGALDACATKITKEMKIAAAYAIAEYVKNPERCKIIPNALDKNVAPAVAKAVRKAAFKSGCARRI